MVVEDKITFNNEFTEKEKKICDASFSEVILYYITDPKRFINSTNLLNGIMIIGIVFLINYICF